MELPKLDEYQSYIEKNVLGFGLLKMQKYYESVLTTMKEDFEKSQFFTKLNHSLPTYNEEYLMQKEYALFSKTEPIKIEMKPFNSMIDKCYRNDIIDNPLWKSEAFEWKGNFDWTNPLHCFEKFSDLLRTRISVRYLDGAVFVLDKLKALADSLQLSYEHAYKAEEEGYYAIHFDLVYPVEVISLEFETLRIISRVEFQINTEIQNLILDLTHKYYEQGRMRSKALAEKWQWDYECAEFLPNYLGHITHYIEGMLMEVRKREKREAER